MKEILKTLLIFCIFIITGCCSQTRTDRIKSKEQVIGRSGITFVRGAELHYIIEGKGIPCIVLGHSLSQRRILSQELRNHFMFIFSDLRHDAQSNCSLDTSEINLDTYLDDIKKVQDTLNVKKIAIFAHSHHAFLAVEYTRKYPDKVSHIIITGCKPSIAWGAGDEFWESDASDERKNIFNQNWEKLSIGDLNRMSPKERYIKTYIAMTPKLLYDPKGDLSYIVDVIDNNKDVYLHLQLAILGNYDIIKGSKISIPVFLALGRYDYVCPYKLWEERKSVFQNLSYNLFDKSGHFPMVEEQELFDKKVIDWIGNH
ncbi:MAG: alpha/beta hydrolase [Bacteroidia bacterium]|nr:alpha/beta hydrolase [Bacteroidia bacterium]